MTEIVWLILPIFLIIFLGFALRRWVFREDVLWAGLERLSFYLLIPALLITTVARADLMGLAIFETMALAVAVVFVVFFALVAARPWLGIGGPAFTSLLQGTVRMNAYIGFAVAATVMGANGLSAFVVLMLPVAFAVNLLCVAALARWGTAPEPNWALIVLRVLRTPLILATLAGLALNLAEIGIPPIAGPLLDILGRAALAVALLTVGAGLDLRAVGRARAMVILSSAIKLIAIPVAVGLVAQAMALSETALFALVLYAALPTASVGYIMARQLGGDAQLMAGIITFQTAASMVTLPLALIWLT